MAGSAAWIDVIPNMAVFARTMNVGATAAGRTAGVSAGRSFSSGLTAGTAGGSGAAAMVKDLEAASKKAQAVILAEKGKIQAARTAEKAAAESVAAAEARLAEQRAKFGATSSQALKAESQLTTAMGRQETSALRVVSAEDQVRAAYSEQTVVTGQLAEAQAVLAREQAVASSGAGRLAAGASAASGAVARMGGAFGGALKTGVQLGALFGAFELAGFVKNTIKNASDFQASMNLLVTAGGESKKALGLVSAGVEGVAVTTGTSLEQLSEGMYTIEKAQIRGAAGVKVLRAAAQAAKAESTDLSTMTNAITSIMRSYDIPASKVVSVTNQLVAASGAAKTNMQEYAGSLSTVLPVASKAGISFAQVGAAIATLTQHGTSAFEATQELSNTIRNLQAPNNVAVTEMSKLGLSANDVSLQLGKKGLTGTVNELLLAVAKNMGPAGLVIQKTFNQSQQAATDAATAMDALPSSAKKIAAAYVAGKVSLGDYRQELKALPGDQANLLSQWKSLEDKSKGYNQQLRNSVSSSQTATAALKQMTGGANGLNTVLQLSGGSAKIFSNNVDEITRAGEKNGKNISTWASTSALYKTQLAELSQTVQVTGVQIATKLLPGFTSTVKSMLSATRATIGFVAANKGWVLPLAAGIAGIAVAFKLAKSAAVIYAAAQTAITAVTFTWTAATEGMAIAMASLDVAMDANPIGLIALAIELVIGAMAALTAGVIYAYTHWTWFRVGVQAAWAGIQVAASFAWNSVLKPTFAWISAAISDTGKWFSWLWTSIIVPAWDGIVGAFRSAWSFISTVWDGITAGAKAVGGWFAWLWTAVTTPLIAIGNAVAYMWNSYVYPVFDLMGHMVMALGAVIGQLWTTYVSPVFGWIGGLIASTWQGAIFPIIGAFILGIQTLAGTFSWLWGSVISPVLGWIGAGISGAWNTLISPVFAAIGWTLSNVVGPAFSWLWTAVIKPVWDAIGGQVQATWNTYISPVFGFLNDWATVKIPAAFGVMSTAVGIAWDAIKDAAKVPIKFVVETVINDGIIANFNKVATFFGSKTMPEVKLPKGFARGGVLDGYQSAKRDDMLIPMRAGEGVLVPEVVRALGPGFVHALNAAGNSGGVQGVRKAAGYATGGIIGGGLLSDPVGGITSTVTALLGKIPGGGAFADVAKNTGTNLLGSAVSAIKGFLAKQASTSIVGSVMGALSGGGSASASAPAGAGVSRWTPQVIEALSANGLSTSADMVAKVLRQMQTESGGNAAAVQHGYTDVNTISGDLAKGLMQTISSTFNAYKFPGHGDIFNGYDNLLAALNYAKHTYGPNLNGLGNGHGYAEGGIIPTLYDQGGLLPMGTSIIQKNTREPEFALPQSRLEDFVANAVTRAGGSQRGREEVHFHNEGRDFTIADYLQAEHMRDVLRG